MTNLAIIEQKVRKTIARILEISEEEIVLEARFREDLDADSLDLVEIVMALEDVFGREIADEDAQEITTVGEAILFIYGGG